MHETCTSRFALVTQGQRDQHRSSVSLQHCLVIPGIFSDMVNGATLCTCIMVTGRYRDASNRVPSNDFPLATTTPHLYNRFVSLYEKSIIGFHRPTSCVFGFEEQSVPLSSASEYDDQSSIEAFAACVVVGDCRSRHVRACSHNES